MAGAAGLLNSAGVPIVADDNMITEPTSTLKEGTAPALTPSKTVPQKRSSTDDANPEEEVVAVSKGMEESVACPVPEVEYIMTEDLTDVENPEASMQVALKTLASKDWAEVCQGLKIVRQLAVFHSSVLSDNIVPVMPAVLRSIKNPRSALCKTALMAVVDLFTNLKDHMLVHMEELLLQLFLKASQDKRFVCEEAERGLLAMAMSLSPMPVLRKMEPYVLHKNPRVRAKSSVYVQQCVSRLGPAGISAFGVGPLMKLVGPLVTDQLPEGREAARRTVINIQAAFLEINPPHTDLSDDGQEGTEESAWERLCTSELSPTCALAVMRLTVPGGAAPATAGPGNGS